MRAIKVSDELWEAIAERGKFGETEDDVLRRVFDLPPSPRSPYGGSGSGGRSGGRPGRGNRRFATKRMSARVENGKLVVEFEDGARKEWTLPERSDKGSIRTIRDDAVSFALENDASKPGQTNAVLKALTDADYHLTK